MFVAMFALAVAAGGFACFSVICQDERHPNALLTLGCNRVCFSGLMINRIMTSRVAALALAAPLLFTAPALADHGRRGEATISVQNGNARLSISTDGRYSASYGNYHGRRDNNRRYRSGQRHGHNNRGYDRGYGLNNWGQDRYEVRQLERRATRACRRAIREEANYIGFRDVDFERRAYARQIGPRGFSVTFNRVEFEGRRRDFERSVTCTVRGGDNVKNIDGIPRWGRRDYSGYSQNDWRTYDRRHVGHDHSRGDYCQADYGF